MGTRIYLEDRCATEFELDSTTTKDASAHDSQVMDKLVHGEEQSVYGDKAHSSVEKKKAYEDKGVKWNTLSLIHKA
jgi:IS5 family transposase